MIFNTKNESFYTECQYPYILQSNLTPFGSSDILITIHMCWEVLFARMGNIRICIRIVWRSGKYFGLPWVDTKYQTPWLNHFTSIIVCFTVKSFFVTSQSDKLVSLLHSFALLRNFFLVLCRYSYSQCTNTDRTKTQNHARNCRSSLFSYIRLSQC